MQISKINSTSFRGLWSDGIEGKTAKKINSHPRVYLKEKVYHPFKDETKEEIKKEMERAKKIPVWMANSYYDLDHYVVMKHTLGERLDITEKDYKKISNKKPQINNMSNDIFDYMPGIKPEDSEHIELILRALGIK